VIVPQLRRWANSGQNRTSHAARLDRLRLAFGLDGLPWEDERALERYELLYELLYESGLIDEARRDRPEQHLVNTRRRSPELGRAMAKNVAAQTAVEIISWTGRCEVHERFTPEENTGYRIAHPGIVVLAHPECPPEVVAKADFAGSTAAMANFVRDEQPRKVVMITKCSMSDNVSV
jgi:hypothetical protein